MPDSGLPALLQVYIPILESNRAALGSDARWWWRHMPRHGHAAFAWDCMARIVVVASEQAEARGGRYTRSLGCSTLAAQQRAAGEM